MSVAHVSDNLQLPLFDGNDYGAWADFRDAFAKIDRYAGLTDQSIRDLQSDGATLSGAIVTINESLDTVNTTLTELGTTDEGILETVEGHTRSITKLNNDVTTLMEDNQTLHEDADALSQQVSTNTSNINKNKTDISRLKQDTSNNTSKINNLTSRVTALEDTPSGGVVAVYDVAVNSVSILDDSAKNALRQGQAIRNRYVKIPINVPTDINLDNLVITDMQIIGHGLQGDRSGTGEVDVFPGGRTSYAICVQTPFYWSDNEFATGNTIRRNSDNTISVLCCICPVLPYGTTELYTGDYQGELYLTCKVTLYNDNVITCIHGRS